MLDKTAAGSSRAMRETAEGQGGLPGSARLRGAILGWVAAGILLAALLALGLPHALPLLVPGPTSMGRGKKAPGFALADQDGRLHRSTDYEGRAFLLVMMPDAADPAARAALRSLRDGLSEFDRIGVKVFGVSSREPGVLRQVRQAERLNFPIIHDRESRVTAAYARLRGARAPVPVTFIVGPEGEVEASLEPRGRWNYARDLFQWARCCASRMATSRGTQLKGPVPDYPLPTGPGEKKDTLYGKGRHVATVVLFLSSRCPCSQSYNDRIRQLSENLPPQIIRFVGVYANAGESRQEIEAHAQQQGFRFSVVKDANQHLAARLGARVTPEAFVLDRSHRLRYHGRVDDSRDPAAVTSCDLRDALTQVITGYEPLHPETPAFGCAIERGARPIR